MKLTRVPHPTEVGRSLVRVIQEVADRCGLDLRAAVALVERVVGGESVNLTLLPTQDPREALNALLREGCAVHPDGDPPSRDQIAEVNPEALFADGFEGALIGYVERFGQAPLALYDRKKCIDILMEDGECMEESPCEDPCCEHVYEMAVEHFDYNVTGAWAGENTPAFATLLTRDDT